MKQVAALLLVALTATAAEQVAEAPVSRGADLELLSAVRRIASDVTRLRGQPFGRPPVAVRAPDPMREVAAEIRAFNVLPRGALEARGRAWFDIGLGSTASPGLLLKALASDLGGIAFDPQGNRLLVAPDRLTSEDFGAEAELGPQATVLMMTGVRVDEPLVAHSLMHVRQLEREDRDALAATTDLTLARSAWAEGEANLVAVRYLFEGLDLADTVMEFPLDPGELLDGRLEPPGLDALGATEHALVRFVYEEGFVATTREYRKGGWEAVETSMARARTCSDVLHPAESRPAPRPFPEPTPPRPGLELADEDTLGEQAIFVLLSTLTGKDNLALLSAEGWSGDRLYRWEPPGGPVEAGITEWVTRWSTAADASDFDYGVGRALAARHPGAAFTPESPGVRVLLSNGRLFRLERRSDAVRLVVAPHSGPPPAGRNGVPPCARKRSSARIPVRMTDEGL